MMGFKIMPFRHAQFYIEAPRGETRGLSFSSTFAKDPAAVYRERGRGKKRTNTPNFLHRLNATMERQEHNDLILGIDTSCDETAAGVVSGGKKILSNVVSSQVATHHPYGGVVPELASRGHIEKIVPVVQKAIALAGVGEGALDGVAVTCGPGLVGALLVGLSFAKAFAYAKGLPLTGVNHLHGHIAAVYLLPEPPPFPFVTLLASGGHTNLYYVGGPMDFEPMGQTRDDAAGEAFDKVAKVLGLGYPGGTVLDRLARQGDSQRIRFPRAFLDKTPFDFSFSGIKAAVARYVKDHRVDGKDISDIAAGFQEAVVEVLVEKAISASQAKDCDHLALVGGVACNSRLRELMQGAAEAAGVAVYIPDPELCTDNAAMIAAMGHHQLRAGETAPLDLDAYSKTTHSGRLGVVR
jgi:N6-L-threonylcarbamoyladenine synthase